MKKYLIILILLSFFNSCKDVEKKTTQIEGNLSNFRNNKMIVAYNNQSDTININEDGNFLTELNISQPTYVYISSNFENLVLFTIPNSNISFSADFKNFNSSTVFDGCLTDINKYLNSQNILINNTDFNSINFLYSQNPEVFIDSFNGFKNSLNSNFQIFKNNFSKYDKFLELEKNRLKYMTSSVLLQYYSNVTTKDFEPSELLESLINNYLQEIETDNNDLLKIWEYKDFLLHYINYHVINEINSKNLKITSMQEYAKLSFNFIDNIFENDEILEYLYYAFLSEIVHNYGINGMHEYFEKYKTISKNKEKVQSIQKVFNVWNKLEPGQISANFSFPDINGNIHSLDDFKGKYLYIDIWATWCAPCRIEMPHLKRLKKTFENKNIEIIGISVDERKSDWENFIINENIEGIQLHAGGWNNDFIKHFLITSIPRFILLDKEGKIISSNAERPSGGIEKILENLEGI